MTLTLVERFRCSRCSDTPPVTAAPRRLRDPKQPIPGSRVAVCAKCYREARSSLRNTPECGRVRAQPVQPAPRSAVQTLGAAPAPLPEQVAA